jgi:hypothetical protein
VENQPFMNTISKIFFIVHPYTHSLHSHLFILALVCIQVHNPSQRIGSGKLFNNRFTNKTLTTGALFTVGLDRINIYDYILIPFTENGVSLGCFSTKKTIYTQYFVQEGSTDPRLFHGIFKVFQKNPNL